MLKPMSLRLHEHSTLSSLPPSATPIRFKAQTCNSVRTYQQQQLLTHGTPQSLSYSYSYCAPPRALAWHVLRRQTSHNYWFQFAFNGFIREHKRRQATAARSTQKLHNNYKKNIVSFITFFYIWKLSPWKRIDWTYWLNFESGRECVRGRETTADTLAANLMYSWAIKRE